MGSSSKSSAATTTTTTTDTQNVNLQGTLGTNVFTDGQVTVTDGGAIEGSLNFAKDAVANITDISQAFLTAQDQVNKRMMETSGGFADGAIDFANNVLNFAGDVSGGVGKYAESVTALASSAAKDDTAESIETLVKWGAGAAVAIAGAYYFSKGK